jgi:hypothetical protein
MIYGLMLCRNLRLGLGVDEVEVLGVLRAFLFLGALKPASEDGDGVPSSTSLLFTCCKHTDQRLHQSTKSFLYI